MISQLQLTFPFIFLFVLFSVVHYSHIYSRSFITFHAHSSNSTFFPNIAPLLHRYVYVYSKIMFTNTPGSTNNLIGHA